MKEYGILEHIEITRPEYDEQNLPKKVLYTFFTTYKGKWTVKRKCFMADNGLAYDMQEYSISLNMQKQSVAHRILVEPEGSDYLRPLGKPGPKGSFKVRGTDEWLALSGKDRSYKLKDTDIFKPLGKFDCLVKSRPVKDSSITPAEILGVQSAGNRGNKSEQSNRGRNAAIA